MVSGIAVTRTVTRKPTAPGTIVNRLKRKFTKARTMTTSRTCHQFPVTSAKDRRIESITPEAWDKSLGVNLRGPVMLTQAALPHLRASDHAAVVNVISVGAFMFGRFTSMYAAGKGGLTTMTRYMAAEFVDDGIRVNALAPGSVDTDMVRANPPDAVERMAGASMMGRLAAPDEMVGPALFLVSDASSYVTGQVLVADGGLIPY